MNPSYFDSQMSVPTSQAVFHQNQGMNFAPAPQAGSLSSSLTFTPSGTVSTPAPPFKNIKSTVKTLTDHFESVLSDVFNADAALLQECISQTEKSSESQDSGSTRETEENPSVAPEVNLDAEMFALLQEIIATNGFNQTATQALLTARYMHQTALSHLDSSLELPQNLDNPTLTGIQNLAQLQLDVNRRYRRAFAETISGMANAVKQPTEEEMIQFLAMKEYKLSSN